MAVVYLLCYTYDLPVDTCVCYDRQVYMYNVCGSYVHVHYHVVHIYDYDITCAYQA